MSAKQMALDALKLAISQNGCDMLLTGEELRECENAIAALDSDLAQPAEAVVEAAAINAELLEACAAMVKWDDAENNAPDYASDGGAHFGGLAQALCSDAFSKARAAIARATQEAQK